MKVQAIFYSNPDGYPPIINSARVLAAAGHQVDILCRATDSSPKVVYPSQVTVRRLSLDADNTWRAYLDFTFQALRRADTTATVFVGHDMHGYLVARLVAARGHRPVIYHCHDFAERGEGIPLGGRLVRAFEKRFARTADLVIVPDRERGAVVASELRLRTPPLIVANAPLSAPSRIGLALQQALAERGLHFSGILWRQGRVGEGHGIEMTIRSLPLWRNRNWGLVIMGPGEAAYIEYLRSVAQSCGVAEQFVYLPPVGYDQVADFTPGAQVGHSLYDPVNVNHQYATTAANKIMEYMAAGLPVLASDRPGLRALVERYECGLTADESDPASIAAAVITLLGDTQRARQMGANGARAFEEEFRYDKQFAPVLAAITELASRRRS
jgi:glycosyltransferase involved in cell wall biosynthesis